MKYFSIILLLIGPGLYAQQHNNANLDLLEEYTSRFGIQFAYNPEMVQELELKSVDDVEGLRNILADGNVDVLELSVNRWLLKSRSKQDQSSEKLIQGTVLDSEGEPLISALIYSSSGTHSALTEEDGSFSLIVRENEKICCQYLGYEVQCLDADVSLNFELEPLSMLIESVEIASKKVTCSISAIKDTEVLNLKGTPIAKSSLGSDVIRSVQLLSGVDATNDLSATLQIRASAGLQSLITLDGIPVYNAESAFGMFSVLNPYVVTKATLHKNAMPLEYGEYTGGYLECDGLGQMAEKLRLNIDLNTLQSLASIQVPIAKSTQISAALRRSNGRISNSQYYSKLRSRKNANVQLSEFFNRQDQLNTSLDNKFGDVYFNFRHGWKESNTINFTLFANKDDSGTFYDNESIYRPNPNSEILITESYLQSKVKANLGLSFKYEKAFKKGAHFTFLFYSANYGLEDSITSNVTFANRIETRSFDYSSRILNQVRENNFKFQFESNTEKLLSWKMGVDLRRVITDFRFKAKAISAFRQKLNIPYAAPYGSFMINYKDIFIAEAGIRNAWIPARNPINFASPRAKLHLKVAEGWYLKSTASYNQQFFRPIELERQLGQATAVNIIATKEIPILRSVQLTMGTNYYYKGLKINSDIYIRQNSGILEQVLSMPGLAPETNVFGSNSYELYAGVNKVIGFDLSSGFEKDDYTFLLTYTLSKSEDQFEKLFDYAWLPDQNNRTHQLNTFASYTKGPWTFSSTYIFGSGVYTLNRAILEENVLRNNLDPADLFKQLPAYKRWDVSTTYKLNLKHGNLFFDVSIFNLTNHNNVNAELYLYSLQNEENNAVGASQVSLLGRVWSLGVRYEL